MGYSKTHPLFVATAFCSAVSLFKLVVPSCKVRVVDSPFPTKSYRLFITFIRESTVSLSELDKLREHLRFLNPPKLTNL